VKKKVNLATTGYREQNPFKTPKLDDYYYTVNIDFCQKFAEI